MEDFAKEQVEDVKDEIASKGDCARALVERVRVKSDDFLESTREEFRRSPVAFMAGALTFGFALGCIIMSGRQPVSPQRRLYNRSREQAHDLVSNASDRISHAAANLKFW